MELRLCAVQDMPRDVRPGEMVPLVLQLVDEKGGEVSTAQLPADLPLSVHLVDLWGTREAKSHRCVEMLCGEGGEDPAGAMVFLQPGRMCALQVRLMPHRGVTFPGTFRVRVEVDTRQGVNVSGVIRPHISSVFRVSAAPVVTRGKAEGGEGSIPSEIYGAMNKVLANTFEERARRMRHRGGVTRELEFSCGRLVLREEPGVSVGSIVWDVGLFLAQYLDTLPRPFPKGHFHGKRVLEIGSGTGLVGLTIGLLGAAEVTLTDRMEVMELLKSNVAENAALCKGSIQAVEFNWTSSVEHLRCPFDVVVGSDLVYDVDAFQALLDAFKRTGDERTEYILGYRKRTSDEAEFFTLLRQVFTVETVHSSAYAPVVYTLKKSGSGTPAARWGATAYASFARRGEATVYRH